MFGQKKDKAEVLGEQTQQTPQEGNEIVTIPDEFYGGKNPEIYAAPKQPVASPEPKKEVRQGLSQPAPAPRQAPPVSTEKKSKKGLFIILIIIGMLLILGGLTWYYTQDLRQQNPQQPEQPTPTQPTQPEVPDPEPTVPDVPTTTPATTTPATSTPDNGVTIQPEDPLEFPRILLVDAVDSDGDQLTDVEEEYYQTDVDAWDSDGDSYYDGLEIENLYSPIEAAPTRLVESGVVLEYINPSWGYQLYYPAGWEVAPIDALSERILISTVTGDFIEVVRSEKNINETFDEWFGRVARGQRITDLVSFENRFETSGYYRQDQLTAYFEIDNAVYIFIYHAGTTGSVPFRQTMSMMYQSFRPDSVEERDIPEQPILPPSTSTPPVTSTQ
jgi:hypothetical protein